MVENFALLAGIDSVPAVPIVLKKPKGKIPKPGPPGRRREDALIAKSKGGKDGKTPTKKKHRDWAASDGEEEEEKVEVKEEKKEEEIEEKKDEEREAEEGEGGRGRGGLSGIMSKSKFDIGEKRIIQQSSEAKGIVPFGLRH